MANRKLIIGGAVLGALTLAGLVWAGAGFSPPVLTGPVPEGAGRLFSGCIPTGQGVAVRPSDRPRLAGDRYIYADGTQVRSHDREGRPAQLMPDGSLLYPDGTRIAHDSNSGNTTITGPDGRVTQSNIRMPVLVDGAFVWGDGVTLPGTDPGGGAGKISPDGSVVFPDGTTVTHDPTTGMTVTRHPDGRVTQVRDPGTNRGEDGNLEWDDGFRAPSSDPSGGEHEPTADGWIRYPDGTMLSHNAANGGTKIIRPDGTLVTHNSDTCDTKEVPIAGGCLGERPVIDQCLVGTWRQVGGGPLDWIRRNARMRDVTMPRSEVTPLEITLKSDGSYFTSNGSMDMEFHRPDDPKTTEYDPVTGKVRGSIPNTAGFWSAEGGTIRGCVATDGRATGAVTGSIPKHTVTQPFSFAGSAGAEGKGQYSCSGTTMKTFHPMPKGSPMEYEFTRISK